MATSFPTRRSPVLRRPRRPRRSRFTANDGHARDESRCHAELYLRDHPVVRGRRQHSRGRADPQRDYRSRSTITPAVLRLLERSEEPTSELQSLMRTSYAVLCLTKKKQHKYI